jgi:hypothetical protein
MYLDVIAVYEHSRDAGGEEAGDGATDKRPHSQLGKVHLSLRADGGEDGEADTGGAGVREAADGVRRDRGRARRDRLFGDEHCEFLVGHKVVDNSLKCKRIVIAKVEK